MVKGAEKSGVSRHTTLRMVGELNMETVEPKGRKGEMGEVDVGWG